MPFFMLFFLSSLPYVCSSVLHKFSPNGILGSSIFLSWRIRMFLIGIEQKAMKLRNAISTLSALQQQCRLHAQHYSTPSRKNARSTDGPSRLPMDWFVALRNRILLVSSSLIGIRHALGYQNHSHIRQRGMDRSKLLFNL